MIDAHSYQRYTRQVTVSGKQIQVPYVVVGSGEINSKNSP